MTPPLGTVMVLTENSTLIDGRDIEGLVALAVTAEQCGVDTVMLSDHVVLGHDSRHVGAMTNPRDYAAPGNQDPDTPWPDSVVVAAAIAARTTTVRIALAALIFPLRHPLALAKQLGTLQLLCGDRLVVQPTVSWSRAEYEALGVAFDQRGSILNEQLGIVDQATREGVVHHHGHHFIIDGAHVAPHPARPLTMWFGGERLDDRVVDRLVRYGHGFHPFGAPTPLELQHLRDRLVEAGRDPHSIEMIGGIRGRFAGADDVASLDEALLQLDDQRAKAMTSVCFKPNHFTDDLTEVGDVCRRVVAAAKGQ